MKEKLSDQCEATRDIVISIFLVELKFKVKITPNPFEKEVVERNYQRWLRIHVTRKEGKFITKLSYPF